MRPASWQPIGMTGILIPTEILRANQFPQFLDFSEDWFWLVRAALKHKILFRCVPEVLYRKRIHENSITFRHRRQIIDNIRPIYERALQ